jgi:endogenous inhibitor of DNA gyrase (YacG/DUF329 family)
MQNLIDNHLCDVPTIDIMGRTGGGTITVPCETCGAPVTRYASQVLKRVYCSRECRFIPLPKRLWSKVDKSGGPDACWPFTGCVHPDGYGLMPTSGGEGRAHRIAWIVTHGKITPGKSILHKCHNPPCCNPSHLKEGDQAENIKDMIATGTANFSSPGMVHPNSLLTDDAVREIRRDYGKYGMGPKLASKFKVSIATIRDVAKFRSWTHIK